MTKANTVLEDAKGNKIVLPPEPLPPLKINAIFTGTTADAAGVGCQRAIELMIQIAPFQADLALSQLANCSVAANFKNGLTVTLVHAPTLSTNNRNYSATETVLLPNWVFESPDISASSSSTYFCKGVLAGPGAALTQLLSYVHQW